MLPELFLHIGTTKTGSTSIQYTLDTRRRELPKQGAYWPVTHGGARRHQLLAACNAAPGKYLQRIGDPIWQGMEPAARMEAYREEFVREIQELPKKINRVIISAEQFSLVLRTRGEIKQLHEYLAPLFSKMTVIIYLRRQDSHYSSMFAQNLRMGNLYEPDLSTVKVGYNQDYDYLELVMRWARVFGEDNTKPRIFERTATNKFDVLDDFFDLVGIKMEIDPDDEKRTRNPSQNVMGQKVLTRTGIILDRKNEGRPRDGFLWNRISESVTRVLHGQGWLPTQEEAQAFQARFEESNEAVRARWFPEREALFSRDFSKLPVKREPADAAAAFEAACAVLLDAVTAGVAREQSMSVQIAKLAEATGDPKRTIQALMHVLRTDARNIGARLQVVEQHIKLGNLEAAAATYKAAQRMSPDDTLLAPMGEKLAELGVVITPNPERGPRVKRRKKQGNPIGAAAEL
jgi:hypothetical protein